MANIQTITVDMDKLEKVLAHINCGDCPFMMKCDNDDRTCQRTIIEDYLMPEKTYHIAARVVYELDYHIKAKSEDKAIQKVREELQEKCSADEDCYFDILDWREESE